MQYLRRNNYSSFCNTNKAVSVHFLAWTKRLFKYCGSNANCNAYLLPKIFELLRLILTLVYQLPSPRSYTFEHLQQMSVFMLKILFLRLYQCIAANKSWENITASHWKHVLIKDVSDTLFEMINSVYHRRWYLSELNFGRSSSPFIGQWIQIAENVRVYQGCFWHCIWYDNTVYHDKPLISIGAIRLSLSRLFLTLYLIW